MEFIYKNLIILLIIFALSVPCIICNIWFLLSNRKKDNEPIQYVPVTPETKIQDMSLVYEAMNRSITKALYYYAMKDLVFSQKCKVRLYTSGKYRDLISYLIRDDVFFTITENGKERDIKLFDCFFQKVYLFYISETSPNIKNLFFKYFSGLTIDNYDNPKAKPSVIPYLVDFTKNFLLAKYDENEHFQSECLKELTNSSGSSEQLETWLNNYDLECIRKICLNIYHITDSNEKNVSHSKSNDTIKQIENTENKGAKNEFSINFHEQSK